MKNQKWKNQINKTLWHQARPSYYWNHREHITKDFFYNCDQSIWKALPAPSSSYIGDSHSRQDRRFQLEPLGFFFFRVEAAIVVDFQ